MGGKTIVVLQQPFLDYVIKKTIAFLEENGGEKKERRNKGNTKIIERNIISD